MNAESAGVATRSTARVAICFFLADFANGSRGIPTNLIQAFVAAQMVHFCAIIAPHTKFAATMRKGQYARCLHEIDSLLATDPNDSDAESTRPFIEALSHFPDQIPLRRPGSSGVRFPLFWTPEYRLLSFGQNLLVLLTI
jgi:hypothetical protein